uniref:SMP domain-containing protein n=1 Tax=Oryza meridionalis TaxID=40149 RepID=A0A0E0E271_9ORYZ
MSDAQAQPIRPGDVYPPSAADHHQARRERDKAVAAADLRVTEADLPAAGKRVVTATAGGQVMAQFTVPVPGAEVETTDAVTIGEALHAAGSNEPVGLADAAAVQAAEMRATGLAGVVPGGVAAAAQKAAEANMRRRHCPDGDDDKATTTTLKDVVGGAAEVLPADKVATREDADRVAAAAARNAARRGGGDGGDGKGVAEAVAAAAEMNEGRMV